MRVSVLTCLLALFLAAPATGQSAIALREAPVFLQPGTTTPLRVLATGTPLEVMQEKDGWVQVEFKDPQFGPRVGWIERALLQIHVRQAEPPQAREGISHTPAALPQPATPAAAVERPKTPPSSSKAESETSAAGPLSASPVSSGKVKSIKIRGYVTNVVSPTEFEIEDYRITRDTALVLDFENADPALKFDPSDIRVGVELEIKGLFNEATGELTAKSMKVDMEQFKKVKQTAVIAKKPSGVQRVGEGWTGEFFADGQRILVSPATKVVYKLTSREKKAAKRGNDDEDDFAPVTSLDQIDIGMLLTYEGSRRITDGAITAERIEVINNDLEEGEAKLWRSLKVSASAASGFKPGELKIDKVGKFKLVPNGQVQQYVSALGSRLIPAYQRDLPEDTPYKIPFKFYVIQDKTANAFALPNGIVVVNSGLIELLENEAQLAAVVGHEIAHSVQEHSWRQMQYHKKKRIGLAIVSAVAAAYGQYDLSNLVDMVQGAIQNGHSRSLENQADRVGLEYMVAGGYDPREAPRVWKLMAKTYGVQATNVFWSTHENQATRRSYLMNELKNNYRELDYTALTTNELEYRRIQELIRSSVEPKARIKVR